MPSIGPLEIAVVLIIALLLFGPKKLPELGHSLGKGMRDFKAALTGHDEPADAQQIADQSVQNMSEQDEDTSAQPGKRKSVTEQALGQ